ncbi:MAG TPA: hypothetical protein VGE21_13355 [Flavobacteriales bacterium]
MTMGHRALLLLICAATCTVPADAQLLRRLLPTRSLGTQYAGSIGLLSVSGMRHSPNGSIAAGLSFGHVPHSHGGSLNTWAMRFMYTPWRVDLNERWMLEPLQTGIFIAYTTGLDLSSHWPSHLEKGYYWWTPNFRQHLYLRTQLSYGTRAKTVQRIAAYFEVNTNDLYVYSWWPNRGAIRVYDILFFGTGVQVYFAPLKPKPREARTGTACLFHRKASSE